MTMAIELNQQIPPQHERLVFGRLAAQFIRLQIGLQIDRFGYLHKNLAGIFKKRKQASDPAGFVFGAEQHVKQGRVFAAGRFAEKNQLRYQIQRAVNGFLDFDQVLNRIGVGLDKPAIEALFADQGQKTAAAVYQFLFDIAA